MEIAVFVALAACYASVFLAGYFAFAAQRARARVLDALRLSVDVAALEERFDSLVKLVRKISARETMRDRRAVDSAPVAQGVILTGPPPDYRTDPAGALAYYSSRAKWRNANDVQDVPARYRAADHGDASAHALADGRDSIIERDPASEATRRRKRSPKTPPPH